MAMEEVTQIEKSAIHNKGPILIRAEITIGTV